MEQPSVCGPCPEVEFLYEIQTKVLRVFLVAIHSYPYFGFLDFLGLGFLQLCLETSTATAECWRVGVGGGLGFVYIIFLLPLKVQRFFFYYFIISFII